MGAEEQAEELARRAAERLNYGGTGAARLISEECLLPELLAVAEAARILIGRDDVNSHLDSECWGSKCRYRQAGMDALAALDAAMAKERG